MAFLIVVCGLMERIEYSLMGKKDGHFEALELFIGKPQPKTHFQLCLFLSNILIAYAWLKSKSNSVCLERVWHADVFRFSSVQRVLESFLCRTFILIQSLGGL